MKGNIHIYFGLTINFSNKYDANDPDKRGQVIFTMYDNIEAIIISAPPDRGVQLQFLQGPSYLLFTKHHQDWELHKPISFIV